MAKTPLGSDYDRMRARRRRIIKRMKGGSGISGKSNFRGHASSLGDATSDAGSGGTGIPFDPTILIYLLILGDFVFLATLAWLGFGANG